MAIWIGAGITLATGSAGTASMFFPIACWILWLCVWLALTQYILLAWRSERRQKVNIPMD
jgi:hypothetical protein